MLDYPVYVGQRLSKMISSDPFVKLKQVLTRVEGKEENYNPDFAEAYAKDADAHRIIDAALAIEGLTRGEGVHACAVLICRDPVNEHVPTKLDTKGGVEITQYEGHTVADMGLLKMDFLGLRTLTVISRRRARTSKRTTALTSMWTRYPSTTPRFSSSCRAATPPVSSRSNRPA